MNSQLRDAGADTTYAVVGSGLIGGSVALRLQTCGAQVKIWDLDVATRNRAAEQGLKAAESLEECLDGVDLVVVATPPDLIVETALEILDLIADDAVVTEVGSVKATNAKILNDAYAARHKPFVASHPMAGKAVRGFENADRELFVGCNWVICESDEGTIAAVHDLAVLLGAGQVVQRGSKQHDRQVAMISHIPQLVVTAVAARLDTVAVGDAIAREPGLYDALRLAKSPYEMWQQIAKWNADAIEEALGDAESCFAKREGRAVSNTREIVVSMSQLLFDTAELRERDDPGTLQLVGPGFRSATSARSLIESAVSSPEVGKALADVREALKDSSYLDTLFKRANALSI